MDTTILHSVTPSLHPQVVSSIKGYVKYSADCKNLEDTFDFAYKAVANVVETAAQLKADELKTDKAKIIALTEKANASAMQIEKKLSFNEELVDIGISTINKQLTGSLEKQAEAEGNLNAEIRAHVKSLPPEDKRIMMNTATEAGDLNTCSAVLCAPAYLSGIDEVEHKNYTRKYQEAVSPELVERLNVLSKLKQTITRTRPVVKAEMERVVSQLSKQLEYSASHGV